MPCTQKNPEEVADTTALNISLSFEPPPTKADNPHLKVKLTSQALKNEK